MSFKMLGGILLVIGTSIWAGMLALPVATATFGFVGACISLFLIWALMTYSAFLILEVNMWLPRKTNLVSMSRATLGLPGQITAWVSYLLLLYCLLSAYISGGADIFQSLFSPLHYELSERFYAVIFTIIFSSIVYHGIVAVDHVNRVFMITKLTAFFLLVFSIMPYVRSNILFNSHFAFAMSTVTVIVTSFGFATILPSLRVYFEDDVKTLRKVIMIGSFVPLICYSLWIWAVHGVLSSDVLNEILKTDQNTTSALMQAITLQLAHSWITLFVDVFVSVSVITSFLAVSLGLSDFLSDGLKLPKVGVKKLFILSLTFLPPLLIVLINPNLFLKGLNYAGTCCVILLALLPAAMAWAGRYSKKIAKGYRVAGGKICLLIIIVVSLFLILFSLLG